MRKVSEYKPVPLKHDGNIVTWACGKCGRIAYDHTETVASKCCGTSICDGCGEKYETYCKPCNYKKMEAEEKKQFERSEKIKYTGGPIFSQNHDEYFDDIDSLRDSCEYNGVPLPRYVYATEPFELSSSAADIVEDMLSEHHEEARYDISDADIQELQGLLDDWCKRRGVRSYIQADDKVIMLVEEVAEWILS